MIDPESNIIKADKPRRRTSRKLTPGGLQKAFLKMIKEAGGEWQVSTEDLNALNEEAIAVRHDPEEDVFHFASVRVERKPILTPSKRIIT